MKDPRRTNKGNYTYPLTEIMFLVVSAVISGANTWVSVATFGREQLEWLRKFAPYSNGIPSHDTLGELFAALEAEAFSECFIEWIDSMTEMTKGDIVALDGKRLRGSYDKASCKSAIHMVSAFAATNGLCLGQVVTDQKSNEITAIPKLLDMLALKGCLVTIDAMGCQKKIAKKIISRKADYILAVKENQEELLEEVKKVFDITALSSTDKSHDVGHGRAEIRTCSIINDLRFLDIDKANWKGLKSIIKIESERYIKISGKTQREIRYYISSSEKEAGEINHSVRNHWAIENNLHWMLDVEFKEDGSRRRMGNSAANFNIINKMALSMLKKHKGKNSVRQTRYRATLSPNFREKLFGF